MAVHIGSIIKNLVKAKGISVEDFSNKINCTRRNAYKIFSKPSIDTELLQSISKVVGENLFFRYIKDEEIASYTNEKIKSSQLLDVFKSLETKVMALGKEKKTKKKAVKKKATSKSTAKQSSSKK